LFRLWGARKEKKLAWCLTKDQGAKFKKALLDKKIDPFKLAEMTSEQRRALFEKYVDPENAVNINSLYESKLLLKNQVTGFKTWAKRALGMKPQVKRDLLTKIERLNEIGVLDPKELQSFKEDLVKTRLGLNISFEEAKTINKLSEERVKARDNWQAKVNQNIAWNDNPNATRKEWMSDKDRIKYGITQVALENYVNDLKLEARKISFKESPVQATLDAVGKVPGIFKSLMASLDNSFFGRQGIKNLFGSREQKKIWTSNFAKSFKDIGLELQAKKIEGLDALDLVKADIYSRPNALNGKYKAGGYKLNVLSEEAFPSSLPERIPGFGRLFKASEAAFSGAALRMRADLADMYISRMEKQGINALNPDEARGVGHMVGSLTGRGSLGKLEPVGREINVLLFSGRFFKANFDTLTAHQFDSKATQFTKVEARKNLLSITAHIAGILFIANMLDPDSVDEDPRSTNFGRIKIFGKWIDITGGMRTLVTLASRLIPTRRNGEWGLWMKSSTGRWTNLTAGKFGQQDATDILMDTLLFNRLSPIARILADAWKGEMFGGEPFDIKKSIIQSVTPLSIQQVSEVKDESFAPVLAVAISEFLGFSVGGYKYKDNWNSRTSQEMINFKEQVGQEKFDQANDSYNRAYNVWLQEVEKDSKYKKLSDDGKDKLKTNARSAIKEKILKEYGYKKKKTKKTEAEKAEEKVIKKLKP
jgi:hypothetical protein